MNATMGTVFKVTGVFVACYFLLGVILITISILRLRWYGVDHLVWETHNPLLIAIGAISLLFIFLISPTIAGSQYYRFSPEPPNAETRLTIAMMIALAACCFMLPVIGSKATELLHRLQSGELLAQEVVFAIVAVTASYAANLLFASIGLRLGLRLSSGKFADRTAADL